MAQLCGSLADLAISLDDDPLHDRCSQIPGKFPRSFASLRMTSCACHLIAASFFRSMRLIHSCNSPGSWFCNSIWTK